MRYRIHFVRIPSLLCLLCCLVSSVQAEEPANKERKIYLASGHLELTAPKAWKKVQPKSRIVQYEFSAPADAKKDAPTARITIMGAGGSVKANIERWYSQFASPEKGSVKENAKVEKFQADGQEIHLIDVAGTFKDRSGGGPFSGKPAVLRKDYRMLAAIIVTKDLGQYFVKITGPKDVCENLKDDFVKMLKELDVK